MTVNDVKNAHAFITLYKKLYKEKFGRDPIINRNKLKFLVVDMLKDLDFDDARQLLLEYIKLESDPSLTSFCYEYDTILTELAIQAEDKSNRKLLLQQTKERVENYRREQGYE